MNRSKTVAKAADGEAVAAALDALPDCLRRKMTFTVDEAVTVLDEIGAPVAKATLAKLRCIGGARRNRREQDKTSEGEKKAHRPGIPDVKCYDASNISRPKAKRGSRSRAKLGRYSLTIALLPTDDAEGAL